ncbi:MAG: zinc ribbon domain-containing protein [Dehalococcoidia bacterium]|nr:MAG: zinc ribbon domain-containing protein [Dehalococcoidia bacterium]
MPIYEYVCASCGHRFEKLVRNTSLGQARIPCPHCHAPSAERIVSSFAVGDGASSPFPPESAPAGGS